MTRKTDIIKDYSNEAIVIHKSQDVAPIISANAFDRANQSKMNDSGVMGRKVASVPIDVLDAWIEEGIDYRKINQDPAMKKKFFARLNDPEFRYFKTHTGHIG